MKYKVGDNVRIKSMAWFDAQKKDEYGFIRHESWGCFNLRMTEFLGMQAKVTQVGDYAYRLNVDNESWQWADWMLEISSPKHTINRRKFSPVGPIVY